MDEKNFNEMYQDLEAKLKLITDTNNDIRDLIKKIYKFILNQKETNDKLISMMKTYPSIDSEILKFNIGGKIFSTYKSTVTKRIKLPNNNEEYYPPNLLEGLIQGLSHVNYDENNACFIDRDPTYFGLLIDYLRYENLNEFTHHLPKDEVVLKEIIKEAEYYQMTGLKELILLEIETTHVQSSFRDSFLNKEQIQNLIKLCKINKNQNWKLIYKASLDGFSSANFHSNCDSKTKTLTIIKTLSDCIFGGYTDAPWSSKNDYEYDSNAFIFSLENKENTPIVMNCFRPQYAIYCSAAHGPNFGGIK
jgi:hypothetical protein